MIVSPALESRPEDAGCKRGARLLGAEHDFRIQSGRDWAGELEEEMATISASAWEQARRALVERWKEVLRRIDAQDEAGVLHLVNAMDEFCDLALIEKSRARRSGAAPGPMDVPPSVPESAGDSRCEFCRGLAEAGGCVGALSDVDRAVLAGNWNRARIAAARYLRRVETMTFGE